MENFKKIGLILVLFIAFTLVSCNEPVEEETFYGKLTGSVIDSLKREPLAGVAVSVKIDATATGTLSATTDADGLYTIEGIPVGEYTVLFKVAGYKTSSKTVNIEPYGHWDYKEGGNIGGGVTALSLADSKITASAGTPTSPLKKGDKISLTFDKGVVVEKLTVANSTGGGSIGGVDLVATWTGDTKVDLAFGANTSNTSLNNPAGLAPKFPYSEEATLPVGSISVSVEAKDGSTISDRINVYTEEKIKLIAVDANYTAAIPNVGIAPSKSILVAPNSKAVKLTFNKAVDANASTFAFGSEYAGFKVVGADVYVYADPLVIRNQGNATEVTLNYTAVSNSDSTDTVTGNSDKFKVKDTFKTLTLVSTNLYPGLKDNDNPNIGRFVGSYPHPDAGFVTNRYLSSKLGFSKSGTIELNFDYPLPQFLSTNNFSYQTKLEIRTCNIYIDGVVPGGVIGDPDLYSVSFVPGGKRVTIKPDVDLADGTTYVLRVSFKSNVKDDDIRTLFDTADLYTDSDMYFAAISGIVFKTSE